MEGEGESGDGSDSGCCRSCHMLLHEPYVQCQGCDAAVDQEGNKPGQVLICTSCFSKGREFGTHRSNHNFSVVKNNFSLFGELSLPQSDQQKVSWSASEEILLLNGVLKFGYGNWVDVAKSFSSSDGGGGKDPADCAAHFQRVYVEDASGEFRSALEGLGPEGVRTDQPVTYIPDGTGTGTNTLDGGSKTGSKSINNAGIYYGSGLIRPAPGSHPYKELAGYNAARADFDSEFDNQFEVLLNGIEPSDEMYKVVKDSQGDSSGYSGARKTSYTSEDEEDSCLEAALSCAALDVYRTKMKARHSRKRLIREYGLLNKAKAMCLPSRYPHLNTTRFDALYRYGSKLMCSMDFDYVLEGLHHEMMLRQQIIHLQEYRSNGLRRLAAINVFHGQKSDRENQLRHLSMMTETIRDWEFASNAPNKNIVSFYEDKDIPNRLIPTTLGMTRRAVAPLDIVGLPAYDKLTSEERDLCTEQRVYPEVFLEIKSVMIDECHRQDGLRLADIRPLVKIDVNKTRKIYDYFLAKELIYKPVAMTEVTQASEETSSANTPTTTPPNENL